MQKKSIEIRDLRNQDWLWTSKKLLFHEKIDGNNYKVYSGLAAYANNNTQEAFPSIDTLSNKLHMSRNTVIKSLSTLEEYGFIKIEKTTGEHNIYILLSMSVFSLAKEIKKEDTPKALQEPTPTVISTPIPKELSLFQILWDIYPNKANKKVGEQKFEKLSRDIKVLVIKDVRQRRILHDTWIKGFVPHLATYVNQERWNDPIVKKTGEKITGPVIHPELRKKLFKANNETKNRDTMESTIGIKSVGDLLKIT